MRNELEVIIPDHDAFIDLVDLLRNKPFYEIQQAWLRKGIEPEGLLDNPQEVANTPPLLFSAFDQSVAGDYLSYPLVRAHINVSIPQLVLDLHEQTPLPEVVVWFAELCLRYGTTSTDFDRGKMDYRFFNTAELKKLIMAAYTRQYQEPLSALSPLNQVYSPSMIRIYAQVSQDDMRAYLDKQGLHSYEVVALGGLRIVAGKMYTVQDYNELGKPFGKLANDQAFGEEVEIACRKRKLQRLLGD